MKITFLLIVWLVIVCAGTYGQKSSGFILAASEPASVPLITPTYLNAPTSVVPEEKAEASDFNKAYYLQKSLTQKINGLVLFTGGSVIGYLGIKSGLEFSKDFSLSKNLFRNQYENSGSCRMALTGLVLVAGSIPYFIYSLKNKNKAGLKLTCQKTSFGTTNKAYKKVTGLTFAFPLGQKSCN